MTLPAPNLDDRSFQDIVDEAKLLIPLHCPEWTDHNVSDPGVALLELFAWMTEMIIYRLNRVPERLYVKFLQLVGIELFPPAPARTNLLFRLKAPPERPVQVPAGTQVATDPDVDDDPVVFMTDRAVTLVQPALTGCLTRTADQVYVDRWDDLRFDGSSVPCFPTLTPGDAFYLGFEQSLASNLIRLDVVTSAEGAGIDPRNPPRAWEAWDGQQWRRARILDDTSEGFNVRGAVTILVPAMHEPLVLGVARAHWLRCTLLNAVADQATYDASPVIESLVALGLGGSASARHAEPAPAERLGRSSGEAAQTFAVRRAPVLPRRPGEAVRVLLPRAEGGADDRWEEWVEVRDFADATEEDHVYTWSGADGEIRFGPRVRRRDGTVRQHGAVPPLDAEIWVSGYRYGGGRRGNVGAGTLTLFRTTFPSIDTVTNLDSASGGVDPESIENAKLRAPLDLRGGQRAVTVADFERLTLQAARDVARARCLAPTQSEDPVLVLVVPRVDVAPEALELKHLQVNRELERVITRHLDERRLLTMRVKVASPEFLGVSVAAHVDASPDLRVETVQTRVETALYRYINPLVGGPDGRGWPFGRELTVGELYALLHAVSGVAAVRDIRLLAADLAKPRDRRVTERELGRRVPLPDGALFASCDHGVVVST